MIETNFHEIRFPEDISYGSIGGPMFSTNIITDKEGKEKRNINWYYSKIRYNIKYNTKSNKDLEKILSLFYICRGKGIGFRFKDWMDYKGKTIIDTENKKIQLTKLYEFDNVQYKRIISKIVENTVNAYLYIENSYNFLPSIDINNIINIIENSNDINNNLLKQLINFIECRTSKKSIKLKYNLDYTLDLNKKELKILNNYKESNIIVTTKIPINEKDYIIDYNTGQFTNKLNGNNSEHKITIVVEYEFDTPVRFNTDNISISTDKHNINNCYNIELIELIL